MPPFLKEWLDNLTVEQSNELDIYLEGEADSAIVEDMLDLIIDKVTR
jgi:hypothetical protein